MFYYLLIFELSLCLDHINAGNCGDQKRVLGPSGAAVTGSCKTLTWVLESEL